MRRLRISHVVVQPVLMWDDGDELTAGPAVQAISAPLSALAEMPDRFRSEVERLQAEADS